MWTISSSEVEKRLLESETRAIEPKDFEHLEQVALGWENLGARILRERRGHWSIPPAPENVRTEKDTFLVSGGAGFIGSHVAMRLQEMGHPVIVVDDFNDYYTPVFKYRNAAKLLTRPGIEVFSLDFREMESLDSLFKRYPIRQIVHLGARAGVRASLEDPAVYVTTNVLGTQNMLEMARKYGATNFVYASSSSVYGGSTEYPFSETQRVDDPISPYAATKKANEVQAANYSRLFDLPVTGLRFFTVYGPGGRPDMSIRKFLSLIDEGKPIPMFGDGSAQRDFTYIDDIVSGILGAVKAANGKKGWKEVFNLGESDTHTLRRMILLIAKYLGRIEPEREFDEMSEEEEQSFLETLVQEGFVERLGLQQGDVPKTYANIEKARSLLGYKPKILLPEGLRRTVEAHLEDKKHQAAPEVTRFWEAVETFSRISLRRGLDSTGRPKDPRFTFTDLQKLREARDTISKAQEGPEGTLAPWMLIRFGELLGEIAGYLPSGKPVKVSGLSGLFVHRKRRRIVQMVRDSGGRMIAPGEESEILRLAREIVEDTGSRDTAVVAAAAGYGTRMADRLKGFEMKHRVFFGDEMILLSLRNMIPFGKRIVVVASEKNREDIENLLDRSEMVPENGFRVDTVVQKDRFGDGDALLTAHEALKGFEGILLFVFADAPTKTRETIEKMALLKNALGPMVPVVIPCLVDEKPYTPILFAHSGPDAGRVVWNWQKADRDDFQGANEAMEKEGLRNVGLFAAEPEVFEGLKLLREEVLPTLKRWKDFRKEIGAGEEEADRPGKRPEFGFADIMKIFPQMGYEVLAPAFANPMDRLNVNRLEDVEKVKDYYRSRSPFLRAETIEDPNNGRVIVRLIDLDENKNPIVSMGSPSVRNHTELRFRKGTDLNSAEVRKAVREHLENLSRRIGEEMGITVLG